MKRSTVLGVTRKNILYRQKHPHSCYLLIFNSIHIWGNGHVTYVCTDAIWSTINIYSQISVIQTSIIRNYWVIRRRLTVPTFFSIIYCNKTTDYSNFDYPKYSIFRSESSVPIKEILIKLPFKIRSPKCHAW